MENKEEEKNGTESSNRNSEIERRPLRMVSSLRTGPSIEIIEERKRILQTPDNWWYMGRVCGCCDLKGGATLLSGGISYGVAWILCIALLFALFLAEISLILAQDSNI
jgi:hypothetical protein